MKYSWKGRKTEIKKKKSRNKKKYQFTVWTQQVVKFLLLVIEHLNFYHTCPKIPIYLQLNMTLMGWLGRKT